MINEILVQIHLTVDSLVISLITKFINGINLEDGNPQANSLNSEVRAFIIRAKWEIIVTLIVLTAKQIRLTPIFFWAPFEMRLKVLKTECVLWVWFEVHWAGFRPPK